MASVNSSRPYLVRALHEWISDNGHTPHLIVDAGVQGVQVPTQYVKDGRIVLNVSHSAADGLQLGNEWIDFQARFAGVPHRVRVPVRAVLAIYARETDKGMAFNENDIDGEPTPPPASPAPTENERRARLKVVK